MTIDDMAFTPTDGLKNTTSFPTSPSSEAAARKQIQDVMDQLQAYLNNTLTPGVNTHLNENVSNGGTAHGINLLAKIAQENWIAAVGSNGWVQDSTPLRYFKSTIGIVFVQGQMKDGTVTPLTAVTTLPTGYRPTHNIRVIATRTNDSSLHNCFLDTAGNLCVQSSSLATGTISFLFSFRPA